MRRRRFAGAAAASRKQTVAEPLGDARASEAVCEALIAAALLRAEVHVRLFLVARSADRLLSRLRLPCLRLRLELPATAATPDGRLRLPDPRLEVRCCLLLEFPKAGEGIAGLKVTLRVSLEVRLGF